MSEHSIEELERQLQAARDRSRQAILDVRGAEDRLQVARNEASGIIGHVLEYTEHVGYGRSAKQIKRRILVDQVRTIYQGKLKAYGKMIVAGGRIGVRRGEVEVSVATDTGLFVETTK